MRYLIIILAFLSFCSATSTSCVACLEIGFDYCGATTSCALTTCSDLTTLIKSTSYATDCPEVVDSGNHIKIGTEDIFKGVKTVTYSLPP